MCKYVEYLDVLQIQRSREHDDRNMGYLNENVVQTQKNAKARHIECSADNHDVAMKSREQIRLRMCIY